ncbi:ZPR1 zinc-finger domain-containing protein [Syncephalis fuscata]|nr:ZPR1 zinc-finger domain-containing protein [Syncephalis fuscata]
MANPDSITTLSDETTEPLFSDIDATQSATEVESYCVNCGENGVTRLLLTRIPHFREIVLSAFECPHCHTRNSEIQSVGEIQEKGIRITCQLSTREDLNRQLVKSDSGTVKFVEIDLEIPATSRRGALTTVEGIISNVIADLSEQQPVRKHTDMPSYLKIEEILSHLRGYTELKKPFTLVVDDPAGNSYVENPHAPNEDPHMTVTRYKRTAAQTEQLGLAPSTEEPETAESSGEQHPHPDEEVISFPANCSTCGKPGATRMHIIEIPYFKEVVIMSTVCDECGYKSNEVKAGGAVSPQGRRISLKLTDPDDLSRDILKSETCGLSIPDIELELRPGTLGGRFTTIEGLLCQIYEELDTKLPFMKGDSAPEEHRNRFSKLLADIKEVSNSDLDDPMANSYLQNLYAPDPDPNMTIEDYDRTWEQNEEWGLNDIKVENYMEDGEKTEPEVTNVKEETNE